MRGAKRENPREGLKLTRKSSLREQVVDTLKREQEEKRSVPLHDYQMQTKWLQWSTEHEWSFQNCPEWKEAMSVFSSRLMKFWMNAITETLLTR